MAAEPRVMSSEPHEKHQLLQYVTDMNCGIKKQRQCLQYLDLRLINPSSFSAKADWRLKKQNQQVVGC